MKKLTKLALCVLLSSPVLAQAETTFTCPMINHASHTIKPTAPSGFTEYDFKQTADISPVQTLTFKQAELRNVLGASVTNGGMLVCVYNWWEQLPDSQPTRYAVYQIAYVSDKDDNDAFVPTISGNWSKTSFAPPVFTCHKSIEACSGHWQQ